MDLIEVMRSQPATRFYKPDPVPAEVFYRAVDAARFGPQGGNRQPVRFLIVTDTAKKARLAELYWQPWSAYFEQATDTGDAIAAESGDAKATKAVMSRASILAANEFAKNLADVPAIIVACADLAETHPTDTDLGRLSIVGGASVYPVVQNLCLALRNEGVATALTTLLCMFEPQVKELLGIPEEYSTAAHVAAGYPAGPFPTKLTRRRVDEIAFMDSFDRPLTAGS
jgi:nitroreductase